MKRNEFNSYVPAISPRWQRFTALWALLVAIVAPQPHRPPTSPANPTTPTIQPLPLPTRAFANETPPHVWYARGRATEARQLLAAYFEGRQSRRQCMAAAMSAGGWKRARTLLERAEVISPYDGRLLYGQEDAKIKLSLYLRAVERRCWESGKYVAA